MKQRLLGLGRPLAELRSTARLRERGAPVPRPALILGRRVGWFWEARVGSVYEEDSMDARAFLDKRPARKSLVRAARAAGLAVRRLHDAGGRHADLHVGNLIVRESDASVEVLVVDLDRARVVSHLGSRRRMAELMRLYRSLLKLGIAPELRQRASSAFFAAYVGGDRALRRALLTHLSFERMRIRVHTLGYRVPWRRRAG